MFNIFLEKSWKEIQYYLCTLKDSVFTGSRPYDSAKLEEIVSDLLGHDTTMSTFKDKMVILHATAADRLPAELHRFRSYEDAQSILGKKNILH